MSIKLHQCTKGKITPVREIVVRGGALGDFLLTLPLLQALAGTGRPLILSARPVYRHLLPPALPLQEFLDIGGRATTALYSPSGPVPPLLASWLWGARVHFFVRRDPSQEEHLLKAGAAAVVWHAPRPTHPPHIAQRFLEAAGFAPPPNLLRDPCLIAERCPPSTDGPVLWLHPGSGGRSKNWPIRVFAKFAAAWQRLRQGEGHVVLSFGEADLALLDPCRAVLREFGVAAELLVEPTLCELRNRLTREPCLYIGNDSGVSHLAAAVGVPTVVLFRSTDPRVWRPLGNVAVLPGRSVNPRAGSSK